MKTSEQILEIIDKKIAEFEHWTEIMKEPDNITDVSELIVNLIQLEKYNIQVGLLKQIRKEIV
ncbi:MAG: hypothetical protein A2Z57_03360 [Planctomycetes bacterium RIFCSPHIGHO2_12_39_6]|nr:MAG: hypothetical protein A2Z57_03360 [Planctomycetes bacterium RIFCSPHIGHO2_12_39_6]